MNRLTLVRKNLFRKKTRSTLLLLAANTMERGSPLARLLRRKKDQTEAEREVAGFVRSLALGLLPRTESAQA